MIRFESEDIFLITGASSGIGAGIAVLLNQLGASVIGVGRNQQRLTAVKTQALYPENFFLEYKDLAQSINELPLWITVLKEKYGKLRGLVC